MAIPTRLPGITYAQLPVTTGHAAALSLPPRLVVIHDTSNDATAAQEAAYAARRSLDGATSAHFYVDGTGPLGSLPLTRQAWAAYSYANRYGWHIEMCGYNAGTKHAVPAATIGLTAVLVRQLCELGGIPAVKLSPAEVADGKRGICGHRDITIGLGVGDHDDPGPDFDWPAFIAAVNGDDVEQTDKLAYPTANTNRNVGQLYADLSNLRDWLYAKPGAAAVNPPPAGSRAELIVEAAQRPPVTAAPVDPEALKAVLLDPEVLAALAKAVNDDAAARLAQ